MDGTFHEQIVVTYDIESVSGHAINKLHVEYWGEDPRLAAHHQRLALERVRPIVDEWSKTK